MHAARYACSRPAVMGASLDVTTFIGPGRVRVGVIMLKLLIFPGSYRGVMPSSHDFNSV